MIQFFGSKLRKAREKMGLNQASFARALGFSSEFISYLESGKRTPSVATINRIASFLNKDAAYFFYEREEPPDSFTLLFRAEAVDERTRDELQKFRRYCDDYIRLEALTGRRLDLAPLYGSIPPERMADEERRRLGLGDEPIKDVFALFETNGCRILRMPMPEDSRVSGVFIFLEAKEAAFALVNSAQSRGRQVFSAAHEYCHYMKDRLDGPVIDNPDFFIDEYVDLYHPRERYAQTFAARFLMPPFKIREIVEKEFRSRRVGYDQALYLKRYFGVSMTAMLRCLRDLGYLDKGPYEEYAKIDPDPREKNLFGAPEEGEGPGVSRGKDLPAGVTRVVGGFLSKFHKRPIPSDRFRLLQYEAARKITGAEPPKKGAQKRLPTPTDEA
jgi:Zn-dependent peptidase ImmA (M78 family)